MLWSDELTGLPPCYLGDFPENGLPSDPPTRRPYCLIVNCCPAGLSGAHWMSVCATPTTTTTRDLFIDTFAQPMHRVLPNLKAWVERHLHPNIVQIPYPIQPLTSNYCGAYCVFILNALPQYNYDLQRLVLDHFTSNDLQYNDRHIVSLWENRHVTE